jgi:hypothetical protein
VHEREVARVAEVLRDGAQPAADVERIAVAYLPGICRIGHLGDVRRRQERLANRYPDKPITGVDGKGFQLRGGVGARLRGHEPTPASGVETPAVVGAFQLITDGAAQREPDPPVRAPVPCRGDPGRGPVEDDLLPEQFGRDGTGVHIGFAGDREPQSLEQLGLVRIQEASCAGDSPTVDSRQ